MSIILGRSFLAASNSLINCRNGGMKITFGDMTLELNIFNYGKKLDPYEDDKPRETSAIESLEE